MTGWIGASMSALDHVTPSAPVGERKGFGEKRVTEIPGGRRDLTGERGVLSYLATVRLLLLLLVGLLLLLALKLHDLLAHAG